MTESIIMSATGSSSSLESNSVSNLIKMVSGAKIVERANNSLRLAVEPYD
jgi:hypothetical protein